jgi:peptidoglycan/LPS O-acetylase OafA/YrhL
LTAAHGQHRAAHPGEAETYPSYRPDIDGLRAIAILSVVLYHAFPPAVPGGFVGVDIFFVISGFLISSIIFRGLLHNRFSFVGFYAGRIRRLFPALLIMLATTFVVGWFSLVPEEFALLGKHIAGGIAFSDNVLLWREAGYFDRASELKPLMHLWSLGIEEQYYMLFPGIIWLLWRTRGRLVGILATLAAGSFLANVWYVDIQPVATFFLPQFRMWELLAGASLAAWHLRGLQRLAEGMPLPDSTALKKRLADMGSIAGLLLVGIALIATRSSDSFPGWWAVLPVAGTAFMIAAGPHALVNRHVLARSLLVSIGLISYPLYLWHWPLLSFARIIEGTNLPLHLRAALLVASFFLAWLTYRLIERPVRFGPNPRRKAVALACIALVLGYIGFNIHQREGLPFRKNLLLRIPSVLQPLSAYKFDDDRYFRAGVCHLRVHSGPEGFADICAAKGNDGKPTLFLWGDSHAAHYFPGLQEIFPELRLQQYTSPGCQPVLDWDIPGFPRCREVNAFVIRKIEELRPDRVMLGSRWLGIGDGDKLRETIRLIKAAGVREVIVMGPVPRWEPNLIEALLARYRAQPFQALPERMRDGIDQDKVRVDRALRRLAEESGARYISPIGYLCNDDGCLVRPREPGFEGMSIAFDDSHLTPEGSRYFMGLLRQARELGHE